MTPEEIRQEALERHGLEEGPDGFTLTLSGFQRASRRALVLRERGDREAVQMLALSPDDPFRWEYCRRIQIEAFTVEVGVPEFKIR
ncbi:hypothetical protein PO587_02685 [Streptomyces gilvifuscus]|uniref:Uncharacterized protein n=1 Tax=Streptomyces gilvifuscus TaxID=1550617 RepID=A0ABT5FLK4_9ACTN|nr:hypothetical protein [Streptomyces gilvifuscus]MDC2953357.1 hypothetical protein [Streptomyces gilvifuscus]